MICGHPIVRILKIAVFLATLSDTFFFDTDLSPVGKSLKHHPPVIKPGLLENPTCLDDCPIKISI